MEHASSSSAITPSVTTPAFAAPSTSSAPPPANPRALPSRSAKSRVPNLAEPSTRHGGVRKPAGPSGQEGGGKKRKRSKSGGAGGGSEGGGQKVERDAGGRFANTGGGKKRKRKKKQDEDDAGEIIDVRMLEDEKKSRGFGKMTLIDYRHNDDDAEADLDNLRPVRVGDVVQILVPGEYAQVDAIRVPRDELHDPPSWLDDDVAVDGDGAEKRSTRQAYLKVSYFYSKKLFTAVEGNYDYAWLEQCKVMGPSEVVKSDHSDWKRPDAIVGDATESIIYCFEDSYPATLPGALAPSDHPLSLYSPSRLADLTASSYALPSLEPPSQHQPNNFGIIVPPYFFGVGADDEVAGAKGELLNGGKDGRRGVAYTRAGFCFDRQRKRHDDENETSEDERKKRRKGRERRKVWPLTFNTHSSSQKPYNPRNVQMFSPHSQRWFDIDDLRTSSETKSSKEKSSTHKVGNSKKKPSLTVNKAVSSTSSAPSQTHTSPASTSSLSDLDDSDRSDGSSSSGDSDNSRDPITADKATTSSNLSDDLLHRLSTLSSQLIVRGGAYGLTGNSYLVTRASDLLSLLSPSSSSSTPLDELPARLSAPQRSNAVAEARELLMSTKKWEAGVEARARGKGAGKGLGKEWRREAPGLRKGEKWVCPVTGREL